MDAVGDPCCSDIQVMCFIANLTHCQETATSIHIHVVTRFFRVLGVFGTCAFKSQRTRLDWHSVRLITALPQDDSTERGLKSMPAHLQASQLFVGWLWLLLELGQVEALGIDGDN